MARPEFDIAFWEYDRTQALRDGTVTIDGVDATYHSGRIVTDVFKGMVRDRAYDVSDLGISYFLRMMDFAEPPFLATAVSTLHVLRHSAIPL